MPASMSSPKVTVLLPVYNSEKYLSEAVGSILAQDFHDFEFLIIDDGSEDGSLNILASYKDKRIRLVRHEKNQGLIKTLNEGISLARGTYIARMDGDDISLPHRLSRQVKFMDEHPHVGIAGTWFELMGTGQVIKHPADHESIRTTLFHYSALGHPTVMMRKDLMIKHGLLYNEEYMHAEDYELWTRCAEYFELANIQEVLLIYRDHANQVSNRYAQIQKTHVRKVREGLLKRMEIIPSAGEQHIHDALLDYHYPGDNNFAEAATAWLEKIFRQNQKHKTYDTQIFNTWLADLWYPHVLTSPVFNRRLLKLFHRSPLRKYVHTGFPAMVKFYLKCLAGKRVLPATYNQEGYK